jgi:hypothetical protein
MRKTPLTPAERTARDEKSRLQFKALTKQLEDMVPDIARVLRELSEDPKATPRQRASAKRELVRAEALLATRKK